jgi:diphthine synthase
MTVGRAVAQLRAVEARRRGGVCGGDAVAVGMARVGQDDQRIVAGTLDDLARVHFGAPLHALVLAAPKPHRHELEEDMLKLYWAAAEDFVRPPLTEEQLAAAAVAADGDAEEI